MGNCLGKSKKCKHGAGETCANCQHPAGCTCEKCAGGAADGGGAPDAAADGGES